MHQPPKPSDRLVLGLSLPLTVVVFLFDIGDLHGRTIALTSSPGAGTTISLRLPRKATVAIA